MQEPETFWQFVDNDHEWMLVVFIVFALALIILAARFLTMLLKHKRIKAGPVEIADDTPERSEGGSIMVDIDVMFRYSDYRDYLKDWEHDQYDVIKETARDAVRLHVSDFISQIRALNHEYYNKALGTGVTNPVRDWHFNTVTKGDIKVVLTKQLMDIFDRNHLLEMTDSEYKRIMSGHYARIKRLVYDALAEDWNSQEYSIDQFVQGMEEHQDRGERQFMDLMDRFRALADQRRQVKAEVRAKKRETQAYIREHGGKLPDGIMEGIDE